jgi:VWFA-related protein
MRTAGSALVIAAFAVSSLVVSGFSRTSQPPAPAPQPPTFRTEANYVRVDVYPTTKDGAPIMDLTQQDFDVVESGTAQKIEQFEHVVIRAAGSQETRMEPNTVREARAGLENPRARVFVIFLDIGHVTVDGSHRIRQPLTDTLNRLIGPDDLVGVMTPDMSPTDIAFARKTTTIEGFLARHWTWGESQQAYRSDPVERMYETCFPVGGAAAEMIERRRQKFTIDAFRDLAVFLRGVREERKAIIAITDGFTVVGPNASLMQPSGDETPPSGPPVVVDPRTGKLSTKEPSTMFASQSDCWRDRMQLANWDGGAEFRQMLDLVNRANASFYPVNPRGLEVFDTPINAAAPLSVDLARLRARTDMLRTLADNTDGVAVVNTNDLGGAMRRIVDDLSNYYLLGYYSTGKLDGRFHPITVRVKRPGVQVRARRGYLASTPSDATEAAARGAAASASKAAEVDPAVAAAAHAVEAAIAPLAGYARDVPLRLQMAAGWKPGDSASAAMWVVGELGSIATMGDTWNDGFDATVTLTTPADATVGSGRMSVPRGARTFRVAVTPSQPLAPGEYVLRVGARAGPASIPSREIARLTIPPAPDATGALFVRRGPLTGNREVPTADLRFRRNEQVRVEIPTTSSDPLTARLLDRTGKPLAVPVTAILRDDADGSRWVTVQLALAPLGPADYVIELASGDNRMLSAFRVIQ